MFWFRRLAITALSHIFFPGTGITRSSGLMWRRVPPRSMARESLFLAWALDEGEEADRPGGRRPASIERRGHLGRKVEVGRPAVDEDLNAWSQRLSADVDRVEVDVVQSQFHSGSLLDRGVHAGRGGVHSWIGEFSHPAPGQGAAVAGVGAVTRNRQTEFFGQRGRIGWRGEGGIRERGELLIEICVDVVGPGGRTKRQSYDSR